MLFHVTGVHSYLLIHNPFYECPEMWAFIHCGTDTHLSYYQFGEIMEILQEHSCTCILVHMHLYIYEIHQGGIMAYRICVSSAALDNARLFSEMILSHLYTFFSLRIPVIPQSYQHSQT